MGRRVTKSPRAVARGHASALRERGIRIDSAGRAREGGRFISTQRLSRIVGGIKGFEARRERSQQALSRARHLRELRDVEAEEEELSAVRPTSRAEREELAALRAEVEQLRQTVQKEQEARLAAEQEAAQLRAARMAETYEERVERFLREGKEPEDFYNEVREIAAHYGKDKGEVFSDLKGSPRGVGAA
jgi:predicted  nucleic acid-binding Zn-ribbon protein